MKKFLTVFSVIVLCLAMAVPSFASSVYPEVPVAYDDQGVLVYTTETGYYALVYDKSGVNDLSFVHNAGALSIHFTGESVPYTLYFLSENKYNEKVWAQNSSKSYVNGQQITSALTSILASTYNVYGPEGGIFFMATPLWEGVLEATETTLGQETMPALVGMMKVLVPCGVGLMALLVVLKLFGKRSLIFLR